MQPSGQPSSAISPSPLLRPGLRYFVQNAGAPPPQDLLTYCKPYAWACIALAFAVTAHCALIYRTKFPLVRHLKHLGALGVFFTGLFLLLSEPLRYLILLSPRPLTASSAVDSGDMDRAAIYYNVGFQLVESLLPQLADNLVFYYVYRCTDPKHSRWAEAPLLVLVLLTMYCSWTFQYFDFPFFLNTNAQDFEPVAFWTAFVYVTCSCLYNIVFSLHFAILLYLDVRGAQKMSRVNRAFCLNCIFHCVGR